MKPGYRPRSEAALGAYEQMTVEQVVRAQLDAGKTHEQIDDLLEAAPGEQLTTLTIDLLADLMWRVDANAAALDTEMDDGPDVRSCCGSHWLEDVCARAYSTYAREGAAIAAGAADDDPDDVAGGVGVQ